MTPRSCTFPITYPPELVVHAEHSDPGGCTLHRMSFLELAPLPRAVPWARLHATSTLHEWGLRGHADDAELIISELVTNAVTVSDALPGRPPVLLKLIAGQQALRMEVHDHHPEGPIPVDAGPDSDHGRGLTIVAALSHRHGWQRITPAHKVVWAEIALTVLP